MQRRVPADETAGLSRSEIKVNWKAAWRRFPVVNYFAFLCLLLFTPVIPRPLCLFDVCG